MLMQYLYEEFSGTPNVAGSGVLLNLICFLQQIQAAQRTTNQFCPEKKNCAKHQNGRPHMKLIRDYTEKKKRLSTHYTHSNIQLNKVCAL